MEVQQQIDNLERRVDQRLGRMEKKLQEVHDAVTGAKGGFRVFLWFMAAIGALFLFGANEFVKWWRS